MPNFHYTPKLSLDEVQRILTAPGRLLELETAIICGRETRVWKNLWTNLRLCWLGATSRYWDRKYIIFEDGREWTYGEVFEWSLRIAVLLRGKYEIRKGDRVAIISLNSPEYIACWWAIHLLGAIPTLVNVWLQEGTTNHCINLTEPKLIFIEVSTNASSLATSVPIVVLGDEPSNRLPTLKALLLQQGNIDSSRLLLPSPEFECKPEDPSCILFTSGTTSLPKAVLNSQRAFIGNIFNGMYASLLSALREGNPIDLENRSPWGGDDDPQKFTLAASPLFHVIGCNGQLLASTCSGGMMLLMRRWSRKKGPELVLEYGVTNFSGVPSIAMDLMEAVKTPEQRAKLKIAAIGTGGAPVPSNAPAEYDKFLSSAVPSQGYGLTETNAITTCFIGDDYKMRPASTGLAPPTVDLRIEDVESGKEVKAREIGEVLIRGSNIMIEYYRDPVATRKAITPEGWFRSGDLGYVDEEGFLYIVDRAKDIIIRGGENIHCITIENALYAHPAILEAAAIAVPDRRLGELVAAVVKLKEGSNGVTEDDLIAHTKLILPTHMIPVMILFKEEPLERNAAGKILKNQLRKDARKEWALKSEKKAILSRL